MSTTTFPPLLPSSSSSSSTSTSRRTSNSPALTFTSEIHGGSNAARGDLWLSEEELLYLRPLVEVQGFGFALTPSAAAGGDGQGSPQGTKRGGGVFSKVKASSKKKGKKRLKGGRTTSRSGRSSVSMTHLSPGNEENKPQEEQQFLPKSAALNDSSPLLTSKEPRMSDVTNTESAVQSDIKKNLRRGRSTASMGAEDTAGLHLTARRISRRRKVSVLTGRWEEKCLDVLRTLENHEAAIWFRAPVDPLADGVPDYLTVVKRPMDFQTVREKLVKNMYTHPCGWQTDVRQVFVNAFKYHPEGNAVYNDAKNLAIFFENLCREQEGVNPYAQFDQQDGASPPQALQSASKSIEGLKSMLLTEGMKEIEQDRDIVVSSSTLYQLLQSISQHQQGEASARSAPAGDAGGDDNMNALSDSSSVSSFAVPPESPHLSSPATTTNVQPDSVATTNETLPATPTIAEGQSQIPLTLNVSHPPQSTSSAKVKISPIARPAWEGTLEGESHYYPAVLDCPNFQFPPSCPSLPPPPSPPPVHLPGALDVTGAHEKPMNSIQRRQLVAKFKEFDISYRKAVLDVVKDELGIHSGLCAMDIRFIPQLDVLPVHKQKQLLSYIRQLDALHRSVVEKKVSKITKAFVPNLDDFQIPPKLEKAEGNATMSPSSSSTAKQPTYDIQMAPVESPSGQDSSSSSSSSSVSSTLSSTSSSSEDENNDKYLMSATLSRQQSTANVISPAPVSFGTKKRTTVTSPSSLKTPSPVSLLAHNLELKKVQKSPPGFLSSRMSSSSFPPKRDVSPPSGRYYTGPGLGFMTHSSVMKPPSTFGISPEEDQSKMTGLNGGGSDGSSVSQQETAWGEWKTKVLQDSFKRSELMMPSCPLEEAAEQANAEI